MPYVISGNLLFLSGQLPIEGGKVAVIGLVGGDVALAQRGDQARHRIDLEDAARRGLAAHRAHHLVAVGPEHDHVAGREILFVTARFKPHILVAQQPSGLDLGGRVLGEIQAFVDFHRDKALVGLRIQRGHGHHDGSGQVSFRYRDSQSGESKVRTLPGADFLRPLLQHVLP